MNNEPAEAGHRAGTEACTCARAADHGPLFDRRFPHTLDEAKAYVRQQLERHEDMVYGPSRWDVVRTVLAHMGEDLLNADAEAMARQATFKSMTVEEGTALLELGPPRQIVIAWVDAARKMLGEAPNYSETRIDFPPVSMEFGAAGELERYVFTVQRAGKTTPHEARRAAETELEEARAHISQLNQIIREMGGEVRDAENEAYASWEAGQR